MAFQNLLTQPFYHGVPVRNKSVGLLADAATLPRENPKPGRVAGGSFLEKQVILVSRFLAKIQDQFLPKWPKSRSAAHSEVKKKKTPLASVNQILGIMT